MVLNCNKSTTGFYDHLAQVKWAFRTKADGDFRRIAGEKNSSEPLHIADKNCSDCLLRDIAVTAHSKLRSNRSHDDLQKFLPPRTLLPLLKRVATCVLKVVVKDRSHLTGKAAVVHVHARFVVQTKRA